MGAEHLSDYMRYCIDEAAAIAGTAAEERRLAERTKQEQEATNQTQNGASAPVQPVPREGTGPTRLWSTPDPGSIAPSANSRSDRQGAILSVTDDGASIIQGWMPFIGKKDS